MQRRRLGEILIAAKAIDENKLRVALAEQRKTGARLGTVLVDLNLISEDALLGALAQQLRVPVVDVSKLDVPPEILGLVPAEIARKNRVLPFKRDASYLSLAMADPGEIGLTDALRDRTHLVIQPYLAAPSALEKAIARHYPKAEGLLGLPAAPAGSRGRRRTRTSVRVVPAFSGVEARLQEREKDMDSLLQRMRQMENLRKRDEDLIRQLCLLLIEKNVVTKHEIMTRLNRPG